MAKQTDLIQLWCYRLNQEHELADQYYQNLISSNQWPSDQPELLSFRCAQLRSAGQIEKAEPIFQKLKKNHLNYYYYYEMSQRTINGGRHQEAVLSGARMVELASNNLEKQVALLHLLIATENLGLSTDSIELKIQRLERFPSILDQQWKAFLSRKLFRQKKWDELFKIRIPKGLGQMAQHRLWVMNLPYVNVVDHFLMSDILQKSNDKRYQDFRVNTILGVMENTKREDVRASDYCDRLYLWTWRWLVGKTTFEQVNQTLQVILSIPDRSILTYEDRYLVYLSLRWLALFSIEDKSALINLSNEFAVSDSKDYVTFNQEKDEINQWMDQGKSLGIFPLPDRLKKELESLFYSYQCPSSPWVVNLRSGIIQSNSPQGLVKSLQLAQIIQILSGKSHFSVEPLIQKFSIGINKKNRISNWLTRLNHIFKGQLMFKLKSSVIEISGDWPDIHFVFPSTLTEQMGSVGSFINMQRAKKTHPRIQPDQLVDLLFRRPGLGRHEIQETLDLPKTSVLKLIKKELDSGRIQRKNRGRSSKYFATPFS